MISRSHIKNVCTNTPFLPLIFGGIFDVHQTWVLASWASALMPSSFVWLILPTFHLFSTIFSYVENRIQVKFIRVPTFSPNHLLLTKKVSIVAPKDVVDLCNPKSSFSYGVGCLYAPIPSKPFTNDHQLKHFIIVDSWKTFATFFLNMVIHQISPRLDIMNHDKSCLAYIDR